MPQYCAQCNSTCDEKAKYCSNCGEMLSSGTASPLLDNRYELVDTVNTSRTGCIYKARDIRLGTTVAIKKALSAQASEVDEAIAGQRFWEEARLLSTFQHDGLPRITNFFVGRDLSSSKTAHYLVMDFIEGRTLEKVIQARGGTPYTGEETEALLGFFRQVLSILAYLHSRTPPFIFGHLKPSHIMVRETRIFLVDFAIGRIFAPDRTKAIDGMQGFVAPEQWKGITGPESDLYSLGAIMYSLLTGINPADPEEPPLTTETVAGLCPGLPGYLMEILAAMQERDREKRPPSAAAILKKLQDSIIRPVAVTTRNDEHTADASPPTPAEMLSAIRYRNFEVMERYISCGGDMNIITHRGSTLLHAATEKGDPETLELLLKGPVDINYKGKIGWTALHLATITGAVKKGKILIDHQADVNAVNDEGVTPLHRAIHWGHEEFIRFLIGSGANLDMQDKSGMTALHHAVMKRKAHLVKILIANGANMNLADRTGSTPLHIGAADDNQEVMKLLVLSGADVNVKNGATHTPLHMIAQRGYGVVADLLIAKGADINAKDSKGQTPLHLAAQADFSMVTFLLSNGADFKVRDNKGITPLQVAISKNRRENVSVLRKYGA